MNSFTKDKNRRVICLKKSTTLDKNTTSNLMIKDSFSSNNVDSLNHKVEVKQPMNEINPANGLISHGGWDIQGNPHGTAFHSSSDSSFNFHDH